jgi:hypothetical protein
MAWHGWTIQLSIGGIVHITLATPFRLLIATSIVALLLIPPRSAAAKGSDIRFRATVVRVDETADGGTTVTVRLQGFDVGILANADTEVESNGDEVGLNGRSAGSFVKIAGFFSADGIVAEEIDILDTVEGQFRLRGVISAVGLVSGGTVITLLGVDVLVTEETALRLRGPDGELSVVDLASGMVADARGIIDGSQLVATRLEIGNRESDGIIVEFEGTITSISGGTLLVDTEAGGGRDPDLTSLLPTGRSVRDISRVEIRDSEGNLVLTGTF